MASLLPLGADEATRGTSSGFGGNLCRVGRTKCPVLNPSASGIVVQINNSDKAIVAGVPTTFSRKDLFVCCLMVECSDGFALPK